MRGLAQPVGVSRTSAWFKPRVAELLAKDVERHSLPQSQRHSGTKGTHEAGKVEPSPVSLHQVLPFKRSAKSAPSITVDLLSCALWDGSNNDGHCQDGAALTGGCKRGD